MRLVVLLLWSGLVLASCGGGSCGTPVPDATARTDATLEARVEAAPEVAGADAEGHDLADVAPRPDPGREVDAPPCPDTIVEIGPEAPRDADPGEAGLSDAADLTPADPGAEQEADAPVGPGPAPWIAGDLVQVPDKYDLLPLPGNGVGHPVVTSNNPEIFTGAGFLYETAREDPERGGACYPLAGAFGVYLHHLNQTGQRMYVHVLVTNPGPDPVVVSGFGSGYNQADTGGLGLGFGPDYRVAEDWLLHTPDHVLAPTTLQPLKALQAWVHEVAHGSEIDGRFELTASAGVYVYVVAAATPDVNAAVALTQTAAPGDVHPPGDPPPPFGREAGVYAWDTWAGAWDVGLPPAGGPHWLGYVVNTATGLGLEPVQAFPALTAFADSAKESVGMYGDDFLFDVRFTNPSSVTRLVDVYLAALGGGSPSFFFNGPVLFGGQPVPVVLTPAERLRLLGSVVVPPSGEASATLDVFIQGLSSIPQALLFVTTGPP